MFSKKYAIATAMLLIVLCVASCGKKEKQEGIKVKQGLAARVADYKISKELANRLYEELPEMQRKQFKGPEGKAKFVDKLIEQHLLYRAALDARLDKEEDVQERMRLLTINFLVSEYFNRYIGDKAKVSGSDVEKYYKEHPDEFEEPPVMRAQYLFTVDSLKAVNWKKRLEAGEKMTTIAQNESEDKSTAQDGGDVGYFNPGGYIKGIGMSQIISDAVQKLEVGRISDIIRFEKGYAIIRLSEKNPGSMKSLESVRSTIESKLRMKKSEELLADELEKLKKKYVAENYIREELDKTKRTAEELWEMAQLESDPRLRIEYYRRIVNQYPNDKNAAQALFMIGFTYAEDLMDYVQARRTFEELKQKYPGSDIIESADWMIENMGKPGSDIGSVEDVQRKAAEDKAKAKAKR